MKQPIQWATGSHKTRSDAANGSRLVNLYAEALPQDSKAPVALYGTPGTRVFSSLPTKPVKALNKMNGVVYAVTATRLYTIDKFGDYTEEGEIDQIGPVSSASNGIDLVFVDGRKGYAYNPIDGLRQLSGDGWYPANTVTYQDGYFIFNRAGTGQFFLSDLLSTEFDPLRFATAEGSPDDAVAVISDHRELWVFGTDSIEVWYNSGDVDFPFERMQGAFVEKGCEAPGSVAKLDNTVYWLGNDGMVYRASGYQPMRASTHAVEARIGDNNPDAFAYTYIEEGHSFYVITFPSKELTLVFDAATGLWHERSHYQWGRHHTQCHVYAYGQHLVGDYQNGNVYTMALNIYEDNADEILRIAVSPPIHSNRSRAIMHCLELDMDSGVGLVTGQGDDPQAMLQWSDDGGKTWSNEHWSPIGKIGSYLTRVQWNRLGMFRQRQYKVEISDPIPVAIVGAYAEVENGRN